MKKLFLLVLMMCIASITYAERTFSFGQISCYCPQTGQSLGGGGVISITVGDGYIIHTLYGKMVAVQQNYDGSVTYMPTGFAGTAGMHLDCALLSADLQVFEERFTSSMGNMSINMINTYTNAGEDGGRYANSWAQAQAASNNSSYDYDYDAGSSYSSRRSSGVCTSCGGTGVEKRPNSGGSRQSWVAYYNSQGEKCPHCGGYTAHFHDRCAHCNIPSY